jgi:hypothetical protein
MKYRSRMLATILTVILVSGSGLMATNYSTPLVADEVLTGSDCVFAPSEIVQLCLYPQYSILLLRYEDGIDPYLIWGTTEDTSWPWGYGTHAGQTSFPSNGYAYMQSDGNFVLYSSGGTPLWSTSTCCTGGPFLHVQDDRNLVVYSATEVPLWSIF